MNEKELEYDYKNNLLGGIFVITFSIIVIGGIILDDYIDKCYESKHPNLANQTKENIIQKEKK